MPRSCILAMLVHCCGTANPVHVADSRLSALVCSQVVGAIVPLSCKRVYPNKVRRLYGRAEPQSHRAAPSPYSLYGVRHSYCGRRVGCATLLLVVSRVRQCGHYPRVKRAQAAMSNRYLPFLRQAKHVIQLLHVLSTVESHAIRPIS